jgi:PadR family transcriptional regulator, regulator of vanillate utilization
VSLRHALLALLEARPMTGYELAKQFDVSAAYVWHARHPHIYTELRRMESARFVEAEEAPRGTTATKRRYFVTDSGCAELLRWLGEVAEPSRERDAAYLKATYFEFGSFELVREHFGRHLEHYRRVAAHWSTHADQLERRDTDLLRRRLAHAPRHAQDAIVAYKVHVYRGLSERARTEIRWAERGLELVDRLERESGLSANVAVYQPDPRRDV